MLAAERHSRIGEALRSSRVVSTEDLARDLHVSVETIRRDLVVLERRGSLFRVHGGATSNIGGFRDEASFVERSDMHREAKQSIGRAAASLVSPGQVVIIDVGTTAVEVARVLAANFSGVVATCSLLAAAELAGLPNIEVLVSGGRLRGGDLSLSNAQAVEFFEDIRADIAFLGSGGLESDAGLTDFYLDEIAVRKTIIKNTVRSYVLADSTKFGRVAPHRVAGFEELDGIITEKAPSPNIQKAIERSGGQIILP
jgi:DeoR family fructose operon transcriptional repressor